MAFLFFLLQVKQPQKSATICERLAKPSLGEKGAKELSHLFAHSSGHGKRGPTFNPNEKLHGIPDKKKKGGSTSQGRPVNITVCRLSNFFPYIPKGKVRNRLKDQKRIQVVQLTRSMSASVVRACITQAFRNFSVYLDSGQENKLAETDNQSLDGNAVCSRRGCLYILDKRCMWCSTYRCLVHVTVLVLAIQ